LRKKKIEKRNKSQDLIIENKSQEPRIKTKKRLKRRSLELIRKLSTLICVLNLRKSAGILWEIRFEKLELRKKKNREEKIAKRQRIRANLSSCILLQGWGQIALMLVKSIHIS